MKGLMMCAVALGILAATAAPSLAGNWYPGSYVPGHYRHHYYYPPAPVVAVPAPVYGYAYPTYAPVVTPYAVASPAPVVTPAPVVAPTPYYYGAPAISFGYRGRGFAVGVGL